MLKLGASVNKELCHVNVSLTTKVCWLLDRISEFFQPTIWFVVGYVMLSRDSPYHLLIPCGLKTTLKSLPKLGSPEQNHLEYWSTKNFTPRSTLSNGAVVIIYSHSQCQYAHHNRPRVYIANLSSHLPLPNAKQISNPAVKPPPSLPGKINSAGRTTWNHSRCPNYPSYSSPF